MAELFECNVPLIPLIYSQDRPNQPIELGSFLIQFSHKEMTYQKMAKVTLQLLPEPLLRFAIPAEDTDEDKFWWFKIGNDLIDEENIKLLLIDKGVSIEVFCVGVGIGEDALIFTPRRLPITVASQSDTISALVFHLLNLPNFRGSDDYVLTLGEPPYQGVERCGRVILKAGGWSITIAATDKTSGLVDPLRRQGGYVITHMGKIEREDSSGFSTKQADDMLFCVYHFLSFALGRRTGVGLPVGFDPEGNRIFEQLDSLTAASGPWNSSYSWFGLHDGGLLSEVFPGFFALWNDDLWKEHLRIAINWYLAANRESTSTPIDAGIIMAQTALERLAWAHCVEHQKIVSPQAFKPRGLSAADRLRMLPSTLSIPTEIPNTMNALNGKPGDKWVDIPDAITAIRNAIVHPSVEKRIIKSRHYYEAWQLSMWLLDLVLLRLCKHSGKYGNRLGRRYVGEVELVPWAKLCG